MYFIKKKDLNKNGWYKTLESFKLHDWGSYRGEPEGNYKNGEKDGPWKNWFKNEQLKTEVSYKDGEFNGVLKSWLENGKAVRE